VLVAGSTGAYLGAMTDLTAGILYHFRAFARNANGLVYGNDVTFTTLPPSPYDYKWYLPSKEEFREAYLKVLGAVSAAALPHGGYIGTDNKYWTSSDDPTYWWDGSPHYSYGNAWWYANQSTGGGYSATAKGNAGHVRAVADFTSTDVYAVKAKVPGGAYVYKVIPLGGGNFRYFIVAPTDADVVSIHWSSVVAGPVPTGLDIGNGEANTNAIIAQHGLTGTSAAKIAKNYSL
jgi:hypothetical protein